ncbi:MAG: hypothetical protein H7246_02055, partial [Phycisphaerae bacterium]|nr:hypothetical protein [Saprospiraceae bacterium]
MKNIFPSHFHAIQNAKTSFQTTIFFFLFLSGSPSWGCDIFENEMTGCHFGAGLLAEKAALNSGTSCDDIIKVLTDPTVSDINNLPPSVTEFKVIGDISVEPGETLTLTNKTVKMMSPYGSIRLSVDIFNTSLHGTLVLNNTIIEGCDQMWGGIDVADHCVVQIENHSEVNDMRFGIMISEYSIYSLKNSFFLRNYQTAIAENKNMLLLYVFTFECYGNLIDGAGLKMWNNLPQGSQAFRGFYFNEAINTSGRPIRIGLNGENQNVFKHCGVGVLAEKSNFDFENNRFVAFNTGGLG